MKYKDYYAILGVPRDADTAAVKKAYRELARKHHPDVSKASGAEARFKEIGEAYATLKDPQRRAAYDAIGQRAAGEPFTPPPDWAGAGTAGLHDFDGLDLADVLAMFGRNARAEPGAAHGRDYEASVRITLEDAHRGTTLSLDVPHGDGSQTLAVTVPPGVTDGQRLRLRGRGTPGQGGGRDGDLYLHIHLAPHPLFGADGHDLRFGLTLSPWEAALGADVEVPTLDGPVLLTVPAGTQAGRRLRLRGRGLARTHGGRGDLYALVAIDVPASLTPQERELFERLRQVSRFNPRRIATREPSHGTA